MDYILKLILDNNIQDALLFRRLVKIKIMKIKEERMVNMKIEIEYNNDKLTFVELKNQKLEGAHHVNPFTTEIGWICNTECDINDGQSVYLIIKDKNDGGRELTVSYLYYNSRTILTMKKISDDHYQGVEEMIGSDHHCNDEYHCFKVESDVDTSIISIVHSYSNEYSVGCNNDHSEFYYPHEEDIDQDHYSNEQMEAINRFLKIKELQ